MIRERPAFWLWLTRALRAVASFSLFGLFASIGANAHALLATEQGPSALLQFSLGAAFALACVTEWTGRATMRHHVTAEALAERRRYLSARPTGR